MKIILGSGSANRRRILDEMGYDFEVVTADIDEKSIREQDPEKLTTSLAIAKSDAIIKKLTEPVILITSDQVVVCNNEILEKPTSEQEARSYFNMYATNQAETVSAVVVTNTANYKIRTGIDRTIIYFKPVPKSIVDKLVSERKVYNWAGGFAVNDPDIIPYIDRIDGAPDSTNGLPKNLTQRLIDEVSDKE